MLIISYTGVIVNFANLFLILKALFIMVLCGLLFSCRTARPVEESSMMLHKSTGFSLPMQPSPGSGHDAYMAFTPKLSTDGGATSIPLERKVYYEAYLTISVSNVEYSVEKLKAVLKGYEGFIVFSSNNSIRYRVKSSDMNRLIDEIGALGELTRKNISGQDITDDYFDTKIRLENAYKARDRYLELLQKAATVDEMVKVEAELQRTTEKIELLEGRIKRYDQQVEYSLVDIYIDEKETPGPLGWIFVEIGRASCRERV